MNVSESLYSLMMEVPPQDIRTLSLKEMDDLGLRFRDPVWQEHLDNQAVRRLNLSKQQFLARKARARGICGDIEVVLTKEQVARVSDCWRREFPGFLRAAPG
jgi:hypothetical protein